MNSMEDRRTNYLRNEQEEKFENLRRRLQYTPNKDLHLIVEIKLKYPERFHDGLYNIQELNNFLQESARNWAVEHGGHVYFLFHQANVEWQNPQYESITDQDEGISIFIHLDRFILFKWHYTDYEDEDPLILPSQEMALNLGLLLTFLPRYYNLINYDNELCVFIKVVGLNKYHFYLRNGKLLPHNGTDFTEIKKIFTVDFIADRVIEIAQELIGLIVSTYYDYAHFEIVQEFKDLLNYLTQ